MKPSELKSGRILVVDDELANVSALSRLLARARLHLVQGGLSGNGDPDRGGSVDRVLRIAQNSVSPH